MLKIISRRVCGKCSIRQRSIVATLERVIIAGSPQKISPVRVWCEFIGCEHLVSSIRLCAETPGALTL